MPRRPIIAGIQSRSPEDDPAAEVGDRFREAMSHWPAGVSLVTVRDEDQILGITVSAFLSVSLDPPLALVSIGVDAGILPSLHDVGRFSVSILAEDHTRLASGFAKGIPWEQGIFPEQGDPLLKDAIAGIVCTLEEDHPAGDHRLIIGRVQRVELGRERPSLVYHRREYLSAG